MSAMGQKRTSDLNSAKSALPPTADILCGDLHVCFVPILLQKSVDECCGR
jgi:hypothetical protein